ncbi:MAG: hypothetical protein H6Q04_3511 [Acidobacteria bacterium]|nr:hypothetical protein [Acidobacteriota bacterium]
MKIIFVSDDLREADFFSGELTRSDPSIRMDVTATARDALLRMAAPGRYDVILLGTSVSGADAVGLATAVRNEKLPVGLVVLLGASENAPSAELSGAGIDGFVHKKADFIPSLAEALKSAMERHQKNAIPQAKPIQLLFAGDFEQMQRRLSGMPRWKLEPAVISDEGSLKLPDSGAPMSDVIIIDLALSGIQTLNAIKEINTRRPEIPIILLTNPGDEVTPVNAMKMGATDCIAKTGNYFSRLVPAIERELKRLELTGCWKKPH